MSPSDLVFLLISDVLYGRAGLGQSKGGRSTLQLRRGTLAYLTTSQHGRASGPCIASECPGDGGHKSYYQFGIVCQLQSFLGKRDLATVTHALITFRLDYCGTGPVDDRWLQVVQNAASWLLADACCCPHITPESCLKGVTRFQLVSISNSWC